MKEELLNLIYEITAKYSDPRTNKFLDKSNPDLNIATKNGHVIISISTDPSNQSQYSKLTASLKKQIEEINGVLSANIVLTAEKTASEDKTKRFKVNAKNIIAVASGKGGVGKSTFAVNFAAGLNRLGQKVAILDADIYGPSIPRMMGISQKPKAENNKLIPLTNFGIKCMSIGFLLSDDTPAIWRGPMVMKALEQMFNEVEWGELDYLIIDLPPGTGDAQLTLAQNSKLTGSIIISTPQDVALIDARKGINMFNKVKVPILGIVENMSFFICDTCKTRHEIFSYGGVKKESEKNNIPFLGELPIDKKIRLNSDIGKPVCIFEPDSLISNIYISIAKKILER